MPKITRFNRFAFLAAALALVGIPITLLMLFHPAFETIARFVLHHGMLSVPLFGVVTITYEFFITNNLQSGTTPPTQAQALNENMLNATLNWADSDTTATLTHNWNLSAAEQSALLPIVSVMPAQSNTGTTVVAVSLPQGTNAVTLTKLANVGSGGTVVVYMLRPNSLIR